MQKSLHAKMLFQIVSICIYNFNPHWRKEKLYKSLSFYITFRDTKRFVCSLSHKHIPIHTCLFPSLI